MEQRLSSWLVGFVPFAVKLSLAGRSRLGIFRQLANISFSELN